MNKKDIRELFEGSDDKTAMRIGSTHPVVSDERKAELMERIQRRTSGNGESREYAERVSGVEIHRGHGIMRYAGIAAACALVLGGIGGGTYLIHKNMKGSTDTAPYAAQPEEDMSLTDEEAVTESLTVASDTADEEATSEIVTAAAEASSEITEVENSTVSTEPGSEDAEASDVQTEVISTTSIEDCVKIENTEECKQYIYDLCIHSLEKFDKASLVFERTFNDYTGQLFAKIDQDAGIASVKYDSTRMGGRVDLGYTYNGHTIMIAGDPIMSMYSIEHNEPLPTYEHFDMSFLAECYLNDMDQWEVIGAEDVAGRPCAVVYITRPNYDGTMTDYFTFWIDIETGVNLRAKFEYADARAATLEAIDVRYDDAAEAPETPEEVKALAESPNMGEHDVDLSFLDE